MNHLVRKNKFNPQSTIFLSLGQKNEFLKSFSCVKRAYQHVSKVQTTPICFSDVQSSGPTLSHHEILRIGLILGNVCIGRHPRQRHHRCLTNTTRHDGVKTVQQRLMGSRKSASPKWGDQLFFSFCCLDSPPQISIPLVFQVPCEDRCVWTPILSIWRILED